MTIEERKSNLDRIIARYIREGYHIESRTKTSAQMCKPKKFSFFWAALWLLVFGVGLLFYLLWYAAKKNKYAFLRVDEKGNVKVRVK